MPTFRALRYALPSLLVLLALPRAAAAQSARDSVLATVQAFTRTMTARDSAGAVAIMRADGSAFAVSVRGDTIAVGRGPNDQYLNTLAATKARLVERIWEPTVLVHGGVAVVWAAYDFHVDGKFSHCGVDAFSLVREQRGWKIATVAYTVERTGCAPSPLGPLPAP